MIMATTYEYKTNLRGDRGDALEPSSEQKAKRIPIKLIRRLSKMPELEAYHYLQKVNDKRYKKGYRLYDQSILTSIFHGVEADVSDMTGRELRILNRIRPFSRAVTRINSMRIVHGKRPYNIDVVREYYSSLGISSTLTKADYQEELLREGLLSAGITSKIRSERKKKKKSRSRRAAEARTSRSKCRVSRPVEEPSGYYMDLMFSKNELHTQSLAGLSEFFPSAGSLAHFIARLGSFYNLMRTGTIDGSLSAAYLFISSFDIYKMDTFWQWLFDFFLNNVADLEKFVRRNWNHWRGYDQIIHAEEEFKKLDEKEAVTDEGGNAELTTESFVEDGFGILLHFMSSIASSEFCGALRLAVCSLVSLRFFNKDYSKFFTKLLGRIKTVNLLDAFSMLVASVATMAQYGEKLFKGEISISDVFMAVDKIDDARKRYLFLMENKDRTTTGLINEHTIDAVRWLFEAGEVETLFKDRIDMMGVYDPRRTILETYTLRLGVAIAEVKGKLKRTSRPAPFAIVISGPPGIGKSSIVKWVQALWSHVKGRVHRETMTYSRVATSEYWDGYNPFSTPIIHYSELGNQRYTTNTANIGNVLAELQSLIDSCPLNLNMSAVEDKGAVFAMPELIIVDTNNPDMHISKAMHDPAAMKRRFLFVDFSVKPEFRAEGSTMLDSDKSLRHPDGNPLDRYSITATRFVPQGNRPVERVDFYSDSWDSFHSYLVDQFNGHIARQNITSNIDVVDLIRKASDKLDESVDYDVDPELAFANYESGEELEWDVKEDYPDEFDDMYMEQDLIRDPRLRTESDVPGWIPKQKRPKSSPGASFPWHVRLMVWTIKHILFSNREDRDFIASALTILTLLCAVFVPFILPLLAYPGFCTLGLGTVLSRYGFFAWAKSHMREGAYNYMRKHMPEKEFIVSVVGTVGGLALAVKTFKYIRRRYNEKKIRDLRTEGQLDDIEEKTGCKPGKKRYKTKFDAYWNDAHGDYGEILPHKASMSELASCMMRNVMKVKLNGSTTTHVLGICQRYCLINYHAIADLEGFKIEYNPNSNLGVPSNSTIVEEYFRVGEDAALIALESVRFKDIRKHIINDGKNPKECNGYLGRTKVRAKFMRDVVAKDSRLGQISLGDTYFYNIDHYQGMCGLPLIIEKNRSKGLIGFHSAGQDHGGHGVSSIFTLDQINEALKEMYSVDPYLRITSQVSFGIPLEEPLKKSPVRYESFHNAMYLGKIPGATILAGKSMVRKSKIFDNTISLFWNHFRYVAENTYSPPLMRPRVVNGEYLSATNLALRKLGAPRIGVDPIPVKISMARLMSHLKDHIPPMSPLPVHEAINGVKGDDFTRRINASTSAGFGLQGTKEKYLPLVDDCDRKMSEELVLSVERDIERLIRGESINAIYKAQLKDEPREISKVRKGKTRVFYMSPLPLLIISRMYLSPFYTWMVEKKELFHTAVGINMFTGAHDLVTRLKSNGRHIIECDYSSFDQTMPFSISMAAATVVRNVLEIAGYNSDALRVVDGILSEGLFTNISIYNDLFTVAGMQPSGKYATAEDNSLKNLLLVMVYWYSHPILKEFDIFDHIEMASYGDDILVSLSLWCSKYFTNNTYAEFCKHAYGMRVTTASKDGEMKDHLTIETSSFLKRSFYFSDRYNIWRATLTMDSLMKAMMWVIRSKEISEETQTVQTCASVLYEIFQHVEDENLFEQFRRDVIKILESQYGGSYEFYSSTLPGYFYIEERLGLVTCGPSHGKALGESEVDEKCKEYCLVHDDSKTPERIMSPPERYMAYVHHVDDMKWHTEDNSFYSRTHPVERDGTGTFYQEILGRLRDVEDRILEEKMDPMVERVFFDGSYRAEYQHRILVKPYLHLLEEREDLLTTKRMLDRRMRYHTQSGRGDQTEGPPSSVVEDKHEVLADVGGNMTTVVDEKSFDLYMRDDKSISEFFSRPVEIASFSLLTGSETSTRWDVWDLWSKDPTVRSKLRNYANMRGDLKVRVAVSGTKFHYGRILVAYEPYPDRNRNIVEHEAQFLANSTWRPLFLSYLSQSPLSSTVDVTTNTPLDMTCPFISTKRSHRLYNSSAAAISGATSFDDLAEAGSLYIWTINPPRSTSATPSDVYIKVYAWMDNISLSVPTGTVMEIVTESGTYEDEKGPVQKFATSAQKIFHSLSDAPVIGQFAKVGDVVSGAAASMAAIFGWSRPIHIAEPMYMKTMPYMNSAHTIGSETTRKITLDPKQSISVDPSMASVDHDEMVIADIARRESYLTTFEWAEISSPLTDMLWLCRVHPNLDTQVTIGTTEFFQPSPMSFAVSPFRYWRGSIIFRFEVVCSAFHRGKLAFFYEPNIAQALLVTNRIRPNKHYITVIDLQETQDVELEVHWTQTRDWAFVLGAGQSEFNYTTFSTTVDSYEFVNGFIGVTPFTELQSPDDSNIDINVYVRAGTMDVNVLSDSNLPRFRDTFTTQSGILHDRVPMRCDLNEPIYDASTSCLTHFGERPVSFRSLMKRYVTTDVLDVGSSPAPTNLLEYVGIITPVPFPKYGVQTFGGTFNLISYLSYAFMGCRGSLRKRIHVWHRGVEVSPYRRVVASNRPVGSEISSTLSWQDRETIFGLNGTVGFQPYTNGGLEIELPYYSSNMFHFSFTDDYIGPNTLNDMVENFTRAYTVRVEVEGTTTENTVTEETAAGEDFMFMRFQGAPYYSV